MRLNKVDLPAPLGPMTACVSPGATSTVTSRTAYTPPNARDTPATLSRSGMVGLSVGDRGELRAGPVGGHERAVLHHVDGHVFDVQAGVVGGAVVVHAVGSEQ